MRRRLISNLYFFILMLCITSNTFAQDLSNKGKDFWITYPSHIDGYTSAMGIYITSDVTATGKIYVGNANVIPFTVLSNTVTRKFLGPGTSGDAPNGSVYLGQIDAITPNAAIHIVSDYPVVVYAHIIKSHRSGASLILPSTVWGRKYIVPSYPNLNPSSSSSDYGFGTVSIVAKDSNTTIQITPSANSRSALRTAKIPYQITLNPGDVYQVESVQNADISGTLVESISSASGGCKPIAVFSSSTWSSFDCGSASGDNLYQQLFPTGAWGKNFLTSPAATRMGDIFRIFVLDTITNVQYMENGVTNFFPKSALINSSFYEYKTMNPIFIQADKPVSALQYFTSQACDNGTIGDPEMIALNPIEQTINNITVFSAHQNWVPSGQSDITNCYLNIIINTNAANSFTINGNPPGSQFISIPGTNYSYLQEDISALAATNPVQHLTADSNFTAIAYGFGNVESYGYNAGTNVKDFSQYITIQNPYPGASYNNNTACSNNPFKIGIVLPFKPIVLNWDFSNNPKISPNKLISTTNPTADSVFISNGITLYYFKLPGKYVVNDTATIALKIYLNNPTSDGCSGLQEIDYNINIVKPPFSNFNIQSSGCVGDSIHFINTTQDNGIPISQYAWNLGNGSTTATINSPSTVYTNPVSYSVKLTNINTLGCYSDTTQIIQFTTKPQVSFTQSSPSCKNAITTFKDQSTIAVGTLSHWYWDFGNGTTDSLSKSTTVSVLYDSVMMDTVRLSVLSNSGCKSSSYQLIPIHYIPIAAFTTPEICLNDAYAQFNNLSTIADGTQNQFIYYWYFGDAYASVANPNTAITPLGIHKYAATGNYNIMLKITSINGCVDSVNHAFTVNGSIPKANFNILNPGNLCSNDSIKIANTSTVDFGNITIVQIYWDYINQPTTMYVDSNPFPGKVYSFEYYHFHQPLTQHYTIRYIAYSGITCLSTKDSTITVYAAPEISLTILPNLAVCLGDTLMLNGIASGITANNVNSWLWDLDNHLKADSQHILIKYNDSGSYTISLKGTTSYGCNEIVKQSVKIYPVPHISITSPINVLQGESVILPAFYQGLNLNYSWSPAIWLNNPYLSNPVCTPVNDTLYTIISTNSYFCSATDSVQINVLKIPLIPNVFTPNGDGVHDTWHITYLNKYPRCTVDVYDRNGQPVFHAYNNENEWDGTYNGQPVPIGVYYYVIKPGNGREPITGSVTVWR